MGTNTAIVGLELSLEIHALTSAHRARVAEILTRTAVFSASETAIALELFDAAHATPASPDYHFLGAFTPEDELAGFACYGPTPATDRTYDLYWIAVDPAAQGSGCGTILLNEVEGKLLGLSARLLVVETSSRSDYAPTRAFYERRGYTRAATVRDLYAAGDDQIIYTKRLQGPHEAALAKAEGVAT